ncbi:odorant receptor 43a-like [Episyrphus balteatus]|uniref:odorant receptor 43a-like n=1 Tax=Episyrphus balteatus TaxID=286459 RepID=UPI002485C658|nr:odorant receptor 43a-like [Episyrphus balteatus]
MIQNLRLISINIKIWQSFGFIYKKSNWKFSLFIIVPILLNIFEILYLLENYRNLETVILSSFMTAILSNSIFRSVAVVLNEKGFIKFHQEIEKIFREAENRNDITTLKTLNEVGVKADKFTKFSLCLGGVGAIVAVIAPFLLNSRELPYRVSIPGIDVGQSPYYEIIYSIEVFLIMPFMYVSYVPFTTLFINYLMFGIGCLRILQSKLENVVDSSKDAEEIYADINVCIRYHNQIIRFSENLSSLTSLVNLVEFFLFSLMLCVLLFFVYIVDNTTHQINAVMYIGSLLYVVLLSYWHANEFSYESLKVAEAAYNSDWTICNSKIKKNILMIIIRSQNALQIYAGGMYPMTLQTFQSVLSATYSYFSVLNGISK